MRLHSTQPAVSAQLKRLRALTGDPLLVRAGNSMTPTDAALQMLGAGRPDPAATPTACSARARAASGFEPQSSTTTFRIAASDYLDPLFLPELVAHLQAARAAGRGSSCCRCPASFDYRRSLARGEVDLVIGNWLEAARRTAPGPAALRRGRLPGRRGSPGGAQRAARAAGRVERYLACEHVAPTPLHAREQGAAPA